MAVNGKTKKKSAARIEKDRKRKTAIKQRKMLKSIAIIVVALAFIALIVFAFAAPPKVVG
jgi:type IV secretory pathway component VirB8